MKSFKLNFANFLSQFAIINNCVNDHSAVYKLSIINDIQKRATTNGREFLL